jgi:uncharacterized protein GlcG (DUF336 family)
MSFKAAPALLAATILAGVYTAPASAADVLTVHRLSGNLASQAVTAAVAACAGQGYAVTAVLVDFDGVEQAMLRDGLASIHHSEAAFDKAYTAVTSRNDTLVAVQRETAGTLPPVMKRPLDHILVGQGGVVVKIGDEVVAGIGVSGSPGGDKDEACARAGLNKIAPALR